MKKKLDPLGSVLLKQGVLDRDQLTDVLDLQAQPLPFASVCHVLGHATEEQLVKALSGQHGAPGVVLGQSIINLACLEGIPRETAYERMILPVYEDDAHLFLAVHELGTKELFNEIAFAKGKNVLPHVALHITLTRAIRLCYAARDAGEPFWYGDQVGSDDLTDPAGVMAAVSDVDDLPEDILAAGPDHSEEDFSGEVVPLELDDIMEIQPSDAQADSTVPDALMTPAPVTAEETRKKAGRKRCRVLVADSDSSARSALARVLRSGDYEVIEAVDGQSTARTLRSELPDVAVLQVMLPGIPGFRLCLDLKDSGRYANVLCILVGGTAAHASNAEAIRDRYKSDAFLPRNVGPGSTLARIEELRGERSAKSTWEPPGEGPSLKSALELYRNKRLGEAVEAARLCVTWDPFSPRFRFIMANMLQSQDQLYEAMDAYQGTVDLVPDWFPALTRLAYLQYQKGFVSRAISTWRKAVDVCPNPNVARNITSFISRLTKMLEDRRR
jgi:CheY-like chemotaxis protein